jgi:hypothetical protein
MRRSFADPRRLQAQARSDDGVASLRAWWLKSQHGSEDGRNFNQLPLAVVMLRFYRWVWSRILELRELPSPTAEDGIDLKNLEKVFEVQPEKSFFAKLEEAWAGKLTTSGDPIWDSWLKAIETGDYPAAWWGGLKPK